MSILQLSLSIPAPPPPPGLKLSSSSALSGPANHLSLIPNLSRLSLTTPKSTIRMGGGPRTYPGGVSKWQWKRMQAKKAKQLLKAMLTRERQIYEMRKRAELRAAVSDLERPWEVVQRVAPTLFSVGADEQVKVLADRFQRPGGFDFWSEKDGPQLFHSVDDVPSARFFPKGVVHSIKPYAKFDENDSDDTDTLLLGSSNSQPGNGARGGENESSIVMPVRGGSASQGKNSSMESFQGRSRKDPNGGFRKKRNGKGLGIESSSNRNGLVSGKIGSDREQRVGTRGGGGGRRTGRAGQSQKLNKKTLGVYDMSLQQDGSYGFQVRNQEGESYQGTKDELKLK